MAGLHGGVGDDAVHAVVQERELFDDQRLALRLCPPSSKEDEVADTTSPLYPPSLLQQPLSPPSPPSLFSPSQPQSPVPQSQRMPQSLVLPPTSPSQPPQLLPSPPPSPFPLLQPQSTIALMQNPLHGASLTSQPWMCSYLSPDGQSMQLPHFFSPSQYSMSLQSQGERVTLLRDLQPPVLQDLPPATTPSAQAPPPSAPHAIHDLPQAAAAAPPSALQDSPQAAPPPPPPQSRPTRAPRNPLSNGKEEKIVPPFPWSTDRRATVDAIETLLSKGIISISGDVQCKRCEYKTKIEYPLQSSFTELARLIISNKDSMHNRALPQWMNPVFPACPSCNQPNSMKPIIAAKKRDINWLFMLLGQTIGTCTLDQLKYFCKHIRKHRTGAKNRVLYTTYLGICKQLDPAGPFDEEN